MSIINNMPTKGGAGINGLIEEYYVYAGQEINAGDFVEFVNGYAEYNNYGTIASDEIYDQDTIVNTYCVELANGQVLVAYGGSSTYIKLILLEFDNVSVRIVNVASIGSPYTSVGRPCLIDDNRIFLLMNYSTNAGDMQPYAVIVQVLDNAITIGTVRSLGIIVNSYDSYRGLQAFLCTDGHVTVLIQNVDSDSVFYMVYTVDGLTFSTYKTSTSLALYPYNGWNRGIQVQNDIFLLVYHGSNYLTYCFMTLNFGIPTLSSAYSVTSEEKSKYSGGVTVYNDKVFFTFASDSYVLNGVAGTLSGTTITFGTSVELTSTTYQGYDSLPKYFSDDKVVVIHGKNSGSGYGGIVVNLKGTTCYPGTDYTFLSASNKSFRDEAEIIQLSNPQLFRIFWTDGANEYMLNSQVLMLTDADIITTTIATSSMEKQVKIATTDDCNGVAKTGGKGGTTSLHNEKIQIYKPNNAGS